MDAEFNFTNRSVLVTGGSNGIGLAIARGFAAAGARVLVTGTRARAEDYGARLEGLGYRQARMEDDASIDALIASIDRLDVLVNNAGTAVRGAEALTPEGFERNVRINLNAVYRLCHGLRPRLAARPGAVVNIASMTSYFASPRVPGYGASKAAIVQLTKSLAALWAQDGIRVNALAPGWIATDLTQVVRETESLNRAILDRTPMGRWGRPEELAGPAMFLASDAAAGFVTGVTIPVDGGYSAD